MLPDIVSTHKQPEDILQEDLYGLKFLLIQPLPAAPITVQYAPSELQKSRGRDFTRPCMPARAGTCEIQCGAIQYNRAFSLD